MHIEHTTSYLPQVMLLSVASHAILVAGAWLCLWAWNPPHLAAGAFDGRRYLKWPKPQTIGSVVREVYRTLHKFVVMVHRALLLIDPSF